MCYINQLLFKMYGEKEVGIDFVFIDTHLSAFEMKSQNHVALLKTTLPLHRRGGLFPFTELTMKTNKQTGRQVSLPYVLVETVHFSQLADF